MNSGKRNVQSRSVTSRHAVHRCRRQRRAGLLRAAIAEAQQTSLAQSGLVGEIQGPTMILDPAQWPKTFAEAPMLAELVKAGKLPPVEQRVPAEPLVWKPLDQIGTYGGTWRRAFTGPGDVENANRINASDKPFFWSADGSKIVPCVGKALRAQRRRQDLHDAPAQGHEMVRWRAVHRRRFRLLVRGPVQQQGYRADARWPICRRRASPGAS